MAGFMSRCPFWSTAREKVECYRECPILVGESLEGQDGEQCMFHGCSESSSMNFRDIIKEDYNFLNVSMYEEERSLNIKY